jgi:hypothetical protein
MFKEKALAITCGLISFSTAFADPPSKPLIDSGYQQTASTTCNGNGCELNFAPTTAPVTEITNVSCYTGLILAGSQVQDAYLASIAVGGDFGGPAFYLQPFTFGAASDYVTVGLNGATKLFLASGATPYVRVDYYTPTGSQLTCTIAGYAHH